MASALQIAPNDALIVIDMQQDFLPSEAGFTGALAVRGGDEIVPGIQALARRFAHVILTADWHPRSHISFASTHPGKQPFTGTVAAPYGAQTLWPDHCIQGTPGAEIALDIPHAELILRKGFRPGIDSYSAFLENDHFTPTGLAGYLRERQLRRLFFCGLAYDFCVGFSAVDGQKMGFDCRVIEDLSRAVALPGSVEQTNAAFATFKVKRLRADGIAL